MSVLLQLGWNEYTVIMRPAGMYLKFNANPQVGNPCWYTAVQGSKIPSHFMSRVYCRLTLYYSENFTLGLIRKFDCYVFQ
jgi:hypothetical protein